MKTSRQQSPLAIFYFVFISIIINVIGCVYPIKTPLSPLATSTTPVVKLSTENTLHPQKDTLSQTGPWLVFTNSLLTSDQKLYALNKDGTGLTALIPEFHIWSFTNQPSSNIVSAITFKNDPWDVQTLMLTFIELPSGNIIHKIPLLSFYANGETNLDNGLPVQLVAY